MKAVVAISQPIWPLAPKEVFYRASEMLVTDGSGWMPLIRSLQLKLLVIRMT